MKTFNRFVAALIAVVLVSLSALAPSGALAGDSANKAKTVKVNFEQMTPIEKVCAGFRGPSYYKLPPSQQTQVEYGNRVMCTSRGLSYATPQKA